MHLIDLLVRISMVTNIVIIPWETFKEMYHTRDYDLFKYAVNVCFFFSFCNQFSSYFNCFNKMVTYLARTFNFNETNTFHVTF